ncbi:Serine racemase [Oopsacas minuta]|uniref:Serine racemase n=1 Tax=Oopsacas minuta TaxID=111878 RepID=A0AAV7KGB3_9METZ|nr:Serine racemase [Oopsacas minuta]
MANPLDDVPPTVDDIRKAAETIKPFIYRTPIMTSTSLDEMHGFNFYFKCENFQRTGSFKFRGCMNAVTNVCLNRDTPPILVAFSSGNHAQAVAKTAQLKGLKAHIVMPSYSPAVKINSVKDFGGSVYGCGTLMPEIMSKIEEVKKEQGENAVMIHPYDNPYVMAGQGTVGLEILEQVPNVDAIVVAVSGGGLISGICIAVKSIKPSVKIYAAEPENVGDKYRSFLAKKRIPMESRPKTIADGLTAPIGSLTWPVLQEHLTDVIPVTEEEIISAMYLSWERLKIIVEPSAAAAFAASFKLKHLSSSIGVQNVCVVVCGGNVDLASIPPKPST